MYNQNYSDEQIRNVANNIDLNGTPIVSNQNSFNGGNDPFGTGLKYPRTQTPQIDKDTMKILIDEVTQNLKNDNSNDSKNNKKHVISDELDESIFKDEEEYSIVKPKEKELSYWQTITSSTTFKDSIIIFILFFLLSQNMVKDFFGQFFNGLNPDDEGKIGINGVFIYGVIFAVLFAVIKLIV